jgi:hypothetical protein
MEILEEGRKKAVKKVRKRCQALAIKLFRSAVKKVRKRCQALAIKLFRSAVKKV